MSNKIKRVIAIVMILNFFTLSLVQQKPLKANTSEKTALVLNNNSLQVPLIIEGTVEVKAATEPKVEVVALTTPVVQTPAPKPVAKPATPKKVVAKPKVVNEAVKVSGMYTCADTHIYEARRVCEVFGAQGNNALKIAFYESRYRNVVISPTKDYGFFQINCPSHKAKVGGDCTKLFDFETNLRIAKGIFDGRNKVGSWNAWSTKNKL